MILLTNSPSFNPIVLCASVALDKVIEVLTQSMEMMGGAIEQHGIRTLRNRAACYLKMHNQRNTL